MSTATPMTWSPEDLVPQSLTWEQLETLQEEDVLLDEAIENAEKLVSEEYDSDEPTIVSSAFNRAKKFLHTHSQETKTRLGFFPPIPDITPGPGGSVDLYWKQPSWALLVNIPSGDADATFYGDCEGNGRIKGSLDPNHWNLGIVTWLSKM